MGKRIKFVIDDGDYAWKYFNLHANQRLAVFNFYIFISALIITGYLTMIKTEGVTLIGAVFSVLLMFISFVFWKLDLRSKQILKNAEAALKYLENKTALKDVNGNPHILKIFTYEEFDTDLKKRKRGISFFKSQYSYSDCF